MRAVRSLILATIASLAQFAAACPMCKDTVAAASKGASAGTGPITTGISSGGSVASGFNSSVYLMLATFIFALGIVAFNIGRGLRK